MELKKIRIAKREKGMDMPMEAVDNLPLCYPSFSANEKQIPEVDKLDTENVIRVVIEAKVTSKSTYKDSPARMDFDILAYKILKTKDISEMSDKEFADYQSKKLGETNKTK